MFESIIALTSSNIHRIQSMKLLKSFASFNWTSVQIEINCRPRRNQKGPFSFQYKEFANPPKKMLRCKRTPLESIILKGVITESALELTCIIKDNTSRWLEATIKGKNKSTVNVIEKQLLTIFKLK
jgi:hypothetical protein